MGLAEARAIKEFETTIYPQLHKEIQTAAGFDVPIEVRWDTLARDSKYVTKWNEAWPKLYFKPIVEAFRAICADELGAGALRAKLQKVIVQNTRDSYSSQWAKFEAGTLTLDTMFTNVDQVAERTKTLREHLEKAL
ncbi:MAG: hypothetical protein QM831_11475 [Kofleriaceae bacterium]